MEKVIIVRTGEINLKGLNRPVFEGKLMKNIRKQLCGLGNIGVLKSQGRIYISTKEKDFDFHRAVQKLTNVLGIVSVSVAEKIPSDFELIKEKCLEISNFLIEKEGFKTFKVESRRGDKKFKYNSPQLNQKLGGCILDSIPSLKVDVKKPDFKIYVEVREESYIYSKIIPGRCGMPVGTNGKALLLLSGGIDSPAAGFMVAKRGVIIDAVHFFSSPYTSDRAKQKVVDLAQTVSRYSGPINLWIVHFTDIQLQINEKCPEDYLTIIMRRFMMRISEAIANKVRALALITGESIGQVASQTLHALTVTDDVVNMPVFRPLIGMDKNEVVDISKKIDTYETSILPYEDCCTVFLPKHPATKPSIDKAIEFEKELDIEGLVRQAVDNAQRIRINPEV